MNNDVFKIMEDLKWKAVGVDPSTGQTPNNQFVSFLPIGLPIPEEDFKNPWTPTQSNLTEAVKSARENKAGTTDATDPANTDAASASSTLEDILLTSGSIGQSMNAYLQTFSLTDTKISIDDTYRAWPNAAKVNDTWYAIINGANGLESGLEANEAIKAALARAEKLMVDEEGNDTQKYEKYNQYRDEYYDAVRERDRQYANALSDPLKFNLWPMQGKIYQDDVDYAWDKWQSRGAKQEIEEAMALLSAQGIDPAILTIRRAKIKYENSLINMPGIGNLPYTFITPSKWYSKNGPGWNTYSQTDYHSKKTFDTLSTKKDMSARISSGFRLFGSLGGSVNHSTAHSEKHINSSFEGLTITFSYCLANINRPWMDSSLMNIGNWFLMGNYPEGCISTGKVDQEFKPDDPKQFVLLPSVVTSMILIKDVLISWSSASFDSSEITDTLKNGGSVSFGNHFVSGSGSASYRKDKYHWDQTIDQNTRQLRVDGVQLIGFVSSIMPFAPKLNGANYTQKKKEEPKKEEPVKEEENNG